MVMVAIRIVHVTMHQAIVFMRVGMWLAYVHSRLMVVLVVRIA